MTSSKFVCKLYLCAVNTVSEYSFGWTIRLTLPHNIILFVGVSFKTHYVKITILCLKKKHTNKLFIYQLRKMLVFISR